jgi:CheY-like chemotaxis protein
LRKTVLIVDDEKAIVDILQFNLETRLRHIFAYDGLEGLRLAREADPDLVLLDVMLPGMTALRSAAHCARMATTCRSS